MTRVLTDFETAIGVDLADTGAATWTNTSKDRAINKAVADLSRFLPQEKLAEFAISRSITDEHVTTAAAHGTYASIANKPIERGTVLVKNTTNTITYVENTDYTMNYIDGKITTVSTGAMLVNTAYNISYEKSAIAIDISSLTDMIRVTQVERLGYIPQQFCSYHTYGSLLFIDSIDGSDQSIIGDAEHILVYYDAEHTAPTASAGSFKPFLDSTICSLAQAYCLFEAATKRTTTAVSNTTDARAELAKAIIDVATARTELGKADTAHTGLATMISNVQKYLNNNTTRDAAGVLANVLLSDTIEEVSSRNIYVDQLNQIGTDSLGLVDDNVAAIGSVLGTIPTILEVITAATTGDIAKAEVINNTLESAATTTGSGIVSIQEYLADGDAFLNTINSGGEQTSVSLAYAKFAETCLMIINALKEKRDGYLAYASARTNYALAQLQEASQLIAESHLNIERAQAAAQLGYNSAQTANAANSKAMTILTEADTYIKLAAQFLETCKTLLAEMDNYISIAQRYVEAANAEVSVSQRYFEAANADLAVSEHYRQQAIDLKTEVNNIWRDRKQYIGDYSVSSNRQMTPP